MTYDASELNIDQLDAVNGGMKFTQNVKNDDVIDARGGQVHALGYTITFDINDNISSATH